VHVLFCAYPCTLASQTNQMAVCLAASSGLHKKTTNALIASTEPPSDCPQHCKKPLKAYTMDHQHASGPAQSSSKAFASCATSQTAHRLCCAAQQPSAHASEAGARTQQCPQRSATHAANRGPNKRMQPAKPYCWVLQSSWKCGRHDGFDDMQRAVRCSSSSSPRDAMMRHACTRLEQQLAASNRGCLCRSPQQGS
jgi:hypothetical protein